MGPWIVLSRLLGLKDLLPFIKVSSLQFQDRVLSPSSSLSPLNKSGSCLRIFEFFIHLDTFTIHSLVEIHTQMMAKHSFIQGLVIEVLELSMTTFLRFIYDYSNFIKYIYQQCKTLNWYRNSDLISSIYLLSPFYIFLHYPHILCQVPILPFYRYI